MYNLLKIDNQVTASWMSWKLLESFILRMYHSILLLLSK